MPKSALYGGIRSCGGRLGGSPERAICDNPTVTSREYVLLSASAKCRRQIVEYQKDMIDLALEFHNYMALVGSDGRRYRISHPRILDSPSKCVIQKQFCGIGIKCRYKHAIIVDDKGRDDYCLIVNYPPTALKNRPFLGDLFRIGRHSKSIPLHRQFNYSCQIKATNRANLLADKIWLTRPSSR